MSRLVLSILAGSAAASGAIAVARTLPAPALQSAPSVTPAPSRGLIPSISDHTAQAPALYPLHAQPKEQISPLVQRQYLLGAQSNFVKWTVKAGGVFPLHHHGNEQVTWIVSGRCDVFSQGRKFTMTAGTVMIIPANIPHEFHCPVDTVDIDFFAPARQDWADGVPSVAARQ